MFSPQGMNGLSCGDVRDMNDERRCRLGRVEARKRILGAAARVFNRKGEGVTVEEIAEEAGYSTSALYKHFSGKDDVLETLWRTVKEKLLDVLKSEPPVELDFMDRMKWMLSEMADLAEAEEEIFRAGMANAPSSTRIEHLDDSLSEIYFGFREVMDDIVEKGIEEGVLDARRDPEIYSMALGGQFRAVFNRWAMEESFPLQPRLEASLELFLQGAANPPRGFTDG